MLLLPLCAACAGAEPDRVKREIEEVIGLDCSNAIYASAKKVRHWLVGNRPWHLIASNCAGGSRSVRTCDILVPRGTMQL